MQSKLFRYVKILSVVGMILASYLLGEQLFHPTFQPCNSNSTINCEAIISGIVAKRWEFQRLSMVW